MLLFSAIEYDDCTSAHAWHESFAESHEALFPRPFDDFEQMVMCGSVWAARSTSGEFVAQAYSCYDEARKECEIGGLMVSPDVRGQGVGGTIMRLALAHTLVEEDILAVPDVRIVAHVLRSNQMPRSIIEKKLLFEIDKKVKIPADELPGLKAEEDGFVHGDEYLISLPETPLTLADWAEQWHDQVNGGSDAVIDLRSGVSMQMWAAALREIAARFSRPD